MKANGRFMTRLSAVDTVHMPTQTIAFIACLALAIGVGFPT